MALEPKREAFVTEYLKCRNGAEAARRAGYSASTARVQASRLLTNANIAEEIARRTTENAMSKDEVLSRLADTARATMEDFVSFNEGPYPTFTLDLAKARERNVLHLIKKIKYDKDGNPDIELYSSLDAQKAIAQLLMAGPKGTKDDPWHINHDSELSDDERLARVLSLLDAARARRDRSTPE